jgi:hypothetical protein
MPISRLPTLSRPQPRWRRPLLWTLGGLLVLEVLYNTVLATGLLATVINHFTHEHPRVEWRRAWSLVPGRVHVRDLKLRHENPSGTSWQLVMDEVKVDLSLLSLLKRTLRAESVDGRGLSVQIRAGPEDSDKDKAPRPPPADPWKVFLYGVQVHEVHEVTLKAARLTGITAASGSMEPVPGHRVSVKDARVQIGPGELAYEETSVAHIDQSSGEFSLESQRQGPDNGLGLIAGLTGGRFRFTATHPPLEELSPLISGPTGVSLKGGAGKLEVDIQVKEGLLAQGTQLRNSGEPLLTLHGSKVQLQEVSVRTGQDEERNWEGPLTFPEATLDLSPPQAPGTLTSRCSMRPAGTSRGRALRRNEPHEAPGVQLFQGLHVSRVSFVSQSYRVPDMSHNLSG